MGTTSSLSSGSQISDLLHTWGSLDELVDDSPLIVMGTLIETHDEHLEIPTRGNPSISYKRTDVVRTFRVTSVLSGAFEGETVVAREATYLWSPSPGNGLPPDEINHGIAPTQKGGAYLIFLTPATDYDGSSVFRPAAAPSIAAVDGDALTFVVADDYVQDARSAGLIPAGEHVPAAFVDVDVADVRASVAGKPARVAEKAAYDAEHPGPGLIPNRRGAALEQLGQELPTLRSAEAVTARIGELGLDAKTLNDPSFCSKVQAIARDGTGFTIDLRCGDVPDTSIAASN